MDGGARQEETGKRAERRRREAEQERRAAAAAEKAEKAARKQHSGSRLALELPRSPRISPHLRRISRRRSRLALELLRASGRPIAHEEAPRIEVREMGR